MKKYYYQMIVAAMLTLYFPAKAQEKDSANVKDYHLFNPVPKNAMRDFSIDRPDVTESPISVDAGHFQFEGDMYKWTGARQGKEDRTINVFSGLYKMGLTHSWDIHIGIEMYNIYQDADGNTQEKGYGNTTIRLKHNFWGNDGDTQTALGMIPYVTFPTSPVDEDILYGLAFPFSYGLSDNLDAGAQFQFDFAPDEKGNYVMSYLQTLVLGGSLVGNFDFYVEGTGVFSQGPTIYLANGGLIYNVNNNLKIDVATNIGLVKEAPTRAYLGLSFRI